MKNLNPTKIIKLLALMPFFAFSQLSSDKQHQVDSLMKIVASAKHDSDKVNAWMGWDNIVYLIDPDQSFMLNKRIDSLCQYDLNTTLTKQEKIFFLKSKAFALNGISNNFATMGQKDKAIECLFRSIKIKEILRNKKGVANSYGNLGNVYSSQGNYYKALEVFLKSLKIHEEIGNKLGVASTLLGIGNIYQEQGHYSKSLEYHNKSAKLFHSLGNKIGESYALVSIGNIYNKQGEPATAIHYINKGLKLQKDLDDKIGMAASLDNIGLIHQDQGDHNKAIGYFIESLKLDQENENKNGIAMSFNNIGVVYYHQNKLDEANDYYNKSLLLCTEIGDTRCMAMTLNNIGNIFAKKGNYERAIEFGYRSLSLAKKIGTQNEMRDAALSLCENYKHLAKYQQALEMYEFFITVRDSINSQENQREAIKLQFENAYQKQSAADSVKTAEEKLITDAQIARQKAEIKSKNNQQLMLYGGLTLVIIFACLMYNRYSITQKQKVIIEEQKHLVDEKNQEILGSINYAKRIQSAILPPIKIVKEYLPNSFILYKPKDIVAGDFYWMERVDETILFAAADCTGHGVPGALVSVVCNNGLNRSVREYGLIEPGKILDKTREIIIQEFEKSEDDVKDGMDISLCALNAQEKTLKWAGANNPIWIVRRNGDLEEIKPNKQPIGKYSDHNPFTTHTIKFNSGDSVYLFTDGYQDQFGGEKGKKFKASKIKELLVSIQNEKMDIQHKIINRVFENWKGNLEQVDDVCFIGVKF